jgi:hypothetical protein
MRCVSSQANYAGPIREAEELAIKIRTTSIVSSGTTCKKATWISGSRLAEAPPAGLLPKVLPDGWGPAHSSARKHAIENPTEKGGLK